MNKKALKTAVLEELCAYGAAISLPELSERLQRYQPPVTIPERTLRRWLQVFAQQGQVRRSGNKRGTKYQSILHLAGYQIASPDGEYKVPHLAFLENVPPHRRPLLLSHIRDLWTHTSTALEGNSLSLGDTHFLLEQGLTVAGKPIREHQEILGHARAIELVYSQLHKPAGHLVNKEFLFALHTAVQTDVVNDIYKPIGAWKVEVNGTYASDKTGQQIFIEFAHPRHVHELMHEFIQYINSVDVQKIKLVNAAAYYAKVHIGFSQIHPFWDGNGRIARLVANLLLLKAGLPPLVIDQSLRREYLDILNQYSFNIGPLSRDTGVWPNAKAMTDFIAFCARCYTQTKALVEAASEYSEE